MMSTIGAATTPASVAYPTTTSYPTTSYPTTSYPTTTTQQQSQQPMISSMGTSYSNPLGTPQTIHAAQQQLQQQINNNLQGPISSAIGAAASSISGAARYPTPTTMTTMNYQPQALATTMMAAPAPATTTSSLSQTFQGHRALDTTGNVSYTGGVSSINNAALMMAPGAPSYQQTTNYPPTTTYHQSTVGPTTYPATSTILSMSPAVPMPAPYPGTSSTIIGSSPGLHSTPIQMAITAGKIYCPPNCQYVPGAIMSKSGMRTIYDCNLVPTFESNLIFSVGQPGASSSQMMMPEHEVAHRGITENSKQLVIARAQKNACC